MKRTMKKLIYIILGAAVLMVCLFFTVKMIRDNRVFNSNLTRYSYSSGGGMDGGYTNIDVCLQNDGTAAVYKTETEWWNQLPETSEYIVDAKLLSDIQELFYGAKMSGLEYAMKSPVLVLDAATSGYYFRFGDDSVDFGSNQIIPKRAYDALRKMRTLIDEYASKGERLPGLEFREELKYDFEYNMPTDGEVRVVVFDYGKGKLDYEVLNGLDENLEYDGSYRLVSGDGTVIVEGKAQSYAASVYAGSTEHYEIELDERLSPDSYCLEVMDYTADFVIR